MSERSEPDGRAPTAGADADRAAAPEPAALRRHRVGGASHLPLEGAPREAPDGGPFPRRGRGGPLRLARLPPVPAGRRLPGPGAFLFVAALGTGAFAVWPELVARGGWTLYPAFVLGVLVQYVLHTELQRWVLATGESVLRGFARLSRLLPLLVLAGGVLHLGFPAWVVAGAEVVVASGSLGPGWWWLAAVPLLVGAWLVYRVASVPYSAVEALGGVVWVVAVAGALAAVVLGGAWEALGTLPADVLDPRLAGGDRALLTGFAAAGAGGYLSIAAGVWAAEKGYGMAAYRPLVRNPARSTGADADRRGYAFATTAASLDRWRRWWRLVRREQFVTFVVGLLLVGTAAMALAARFAGDRSGVYLWAAVARGLGGPGALVLSAALVVGLVGAAVVACEAFVRTTLAVCYDRYGERAGWDRSRAFYALLTLFVVWTVLAVSLRLSRPQVLLSAGLFVGSALTWLAATGALLLNTGSLPAPLRPGWGRVLALWAATGCYGYVTVRLVGVALADPAYGVGAAMHTAPLVVESGPGGYALWAGAALVWTYAVVRSARATLAGSRPPDPGRRAPADARR